MLFELRQSIDYINCSWCACLVCEVTEMLVSILNVCGDEDDELLDDEGSFMITLLVMLPFILSCHKLIGCHDTVAPSSAVRRFVCRLDSLELAARLSP